MQNPLGSGPLTLVRPGWRHALGRFRRRLVWAIVFFNCVLAGGTIGYRLVEGWSWSDAAWMAITTATSVGYGEVHPLTNAGRLFTMVLLAFSVLGLGLLWALATALVIELDLTQIWRRIRVQNRIDALSGHYVVCGLGRMGRVVVAEMARDRRPFVVVDRSGERIETLREQYPDLRCVEGDATSDAVLEAAGIRRAKGLAACLNSDADNLFLCLTARALSPTLDIAVRAENGESAGKMRHAGANHVILPTVTGGSRLAAMLLRPTVVSFLDATTMTDEFALQLEELEVPKESRLDGLSLAEARIPQETGLIVLALKPREGGSATFNPGPTTRLNAGDVMIVLGQPEQLERLRAHAGA